MRVCEATYCNLERRHQQHLGCTDAPKRNTCWPVAHVVTPPYTDDDRTEVYCNVEGVRYVELKFGVGGRSCYLTRAKRAGLPVFVI